MQEIAPVERDMALEKLRDLYEALRFSLVPRSVVGRVLPQRAASEAPHRASRVVAPGVRVAPYDEEDSEFEMVDLSEVLSLGVRSPKFLHGRKRCPLRKVRHVASLRPTND